MPHTTTISTLRFIELLDKEATLDDFCTEIKDCTGKPWATRFMLVGELLQLTVSMAIVLPKLRNMTLT
jgi:hypothetical protein